ncbi:hypothetical protein H3U94_09645 [Bartonella sp. W8125]|uniref:hypothetical protein n=1 Tax=Bartonella TaxID=773 RepID=UPI0018DDDC3A|nr:hypothetical protein [Bartonella choladocola]MBI0141133.1 hypothetical protein [Bartonella choladocola]
MEGQRNENKGKGASHSRQALLYREGTEKKRNRRAKGIARRGNSKVKEEQGVGTVRRGKGRSRSAKARLDREGTEGRKKGEGDQKSYGLIGKE